MFSFLNTFIQKSRKMFLIWWIWILFLILPLVKYSAVPQGYEISKFIFWQIWWLAYLLWFLLTGEWRNLLSIKSPAVKMGWIFILIMLFTSFQGKEVSLLGSVFRKQGWFFFFQLWIFFLGLRGNKKELFPLSFQGLGLSTVILVGIGIWERFVGWARVGGSFGEPNAFGGYLVLVFPLLLNKRWWFAGILALIGVYLTESRSAAVALGVAIAVSLIGRVKSHKITIIQTAVFGLIIISTIFFTYNWRGLRISLQDNRLGIWKMAVNAIIARPLSGYGVDNIEGVLNNFVSGKELGMKGLVIDRAHSLFLDLWLWSGVFGVISFIGFLGGIIWEYIKSGKNKDWNLIASIFSFLVFSSFNPISISIWVLFYWVLAMVSKTEK
ncbi:O-antigen ligase family protein [Candidatus Gottesmanbacteria bacterium]|nr:O-antigen ligase family protein [Candidatus Gottesmanbacteria bacterium]